ncbi:hypothetical protein ASZ90_014567 [hydrocarbon metagenome]|uniref:YdhG-like domain-containing protein n=1 Tax=hydrocarbon metagenome TaxID=938273 RepID=A0A0W8F4H4_9ZZZZ
MDARKRKIETIDDYIGTFPLEVQKILQNLRATIREVAPGAEEAIRYGIPTFRLHGNLVHFAAFKNHIGLYPGPSAIDAFRNELSSYTLSKGTIQFPIKKPIPFDLVRRIVEYRVTENREQGREEK